MSKLQKIMKFACLGIVSIMSIAFVSADASAQGYVLSMPSGTSGFLSDGFYSTYNILTSRLIPSSSSSATLSITPYKNSKKTSAKMTTKTITSPVSGTNYLREHTTSATGNTYYIHLSVSGGSVNGSYNIISSNVVQT